MIKRITLYSTALLIGLLINACTVRAFRFTHDYDDSDAELMEYVARVEEISEGRMRFSKSRGRIGFKPYMRIGEHDVAGFCSFVLPMGYDIDISKLTWDYSTDASKFFLVAHEMQHCVCTNIAHDDREDLYGCPESYFHPSMPPVLCLQMNMKKYLDQVKKGCDL